MRRLWVLSIVLAMLSTVTLAVAEETAQKEEEKPAVVTSVGTTPVKIFGGVTLNTFIVNNAYFGSTSQPAEHNTSRYVWGEWLGRVRFEVDVSENVTGAFGLHGIVTAGQDYYANKDSDHMMMDQAFMSFKNLGGSKLGFTIGRQDILVGDGFVLGDGFYDNRAALWSIPMNFWDGVRVDYGSEKAKFMAVVVNLNSSFGPQRGALYGLDASATPNEKLTFGIDHFRRSDDGEMNNDTNVTSFRGSATFGQMNLAGEYALQRGKRAEVSVEAQAYHIDGTYTFSADRGAYVKASYLFYSGDDANTTKNEQYVWPFYRWYDWDQYWLGDLTSATMLFNQDEKVMKLEAGFKPTSITKLRAIFLNLKLDTGSSFGFAANGKDFANELNVVLDIIPNSTYSLWILGGITKPGDAAKSIYGDKTSAELLTSFNVTF